MTDATPLPPMRRPGASEMLRSLGLLVDGPAAWGRPVPSRAPGVFVVELPASLAEAPVDIVAVRHWIEHAPALTLDGERPEPAELARRLHDFWLPDEPVLYVGRSPKQIGARVNSMYATTLGDARPHSGGHWLKTLSVLPELRIWWAETDAHEEYEDALLSEVAQRNSGLGRDAATGGLLPFANLMNGEGARKAHGLLNSLVQEQVEPTGVKPKAKAPVRKPAGSRSTSRTTAEPRARRPTAPRDPPPRPQTMPTYVSREGLDKLNAELDDLRTVQRPQIIDRVAVARSHGDLKENAEYEYARKEQSFMEGRIQTLEQMIRHAEVIETGGSSDSVRVGSTVEVESDGERFTYVIVGSTEASPASGRLSNNSPVGRALLGARAGDEVSVELPSGSVTYRVVEVS